MKTDDVGFVEYILADAESPRIAAECFAQNASERGVALSELQEAVLLILRYDDVIQVHGLAEVVEEMAPDFERLAGALDKFGCSDHAAEIRAIIKDLDGLPRNDFNVISEFVRGKGDYDSATIRLTQDVEKIRRNVVKALIERKAPSLGD
ncbi:MAG: hypothetical protein H7067_02525 [Burkholderiales bacterium]|nr:hypothetical protein [Opitutaceae bacterium]